MRTNDDAASYGTGSRINNPSRRVWHHPGPPGAVRTGTGSATLHDVTLPQSFAGRLSTCTASVDRLFDSVRQLNEPATSAAANFTLQLAVVQEIIPVMAVDSAIRMIVASGL